jgi:DNA modification methylase
MDDKTRALLGDREAAKRLTDAGVVLMQGDCLELLQDIPDGSVDMVLTDPPYSSGGMYRSDRANGSSKKYQSTDTKDIKPDFAGDNRDQRSFTLWETFWVSAAKKKMRPGGIAVIFTDWRQLAATIDAVQCGGLVYRGVFHGLKPQRDHKKGGLRKTPNIVFGHQMDIFQMRVETTKDILFVIRKQHLDGYTRLKNLSSCWSI